MQHEKYIPGFWDATGRPRADILYRWPSRTAGFTQPVYDYAAMPTDGGFIAACDKAGIKPTRRQYRRWCNGTGAARNATK